MPADTRRIKIASASLSQTVYNFATNVANLRTAIDRAVADRADILATEELSLTGYPADDYHQWNKNNDAVWTYLTYLARYTDEKDPNLVVTIGAPWHYADKTKLATDPAYNINNRPFNAHFIIQGGRVIAISAKSILADGAAEYEPRQFNNWPLSQGTIKIILADGGEVPFGKPVVFLSDKDGAISLTNEICAEGWPGIHDDLSIDAREMGEARHIVALADDYDLSVVLNPSASKPQPAINKENIRAEGLCKTGSCYCGAYLYTNYLGSASGTYAAEGSQIFAQNGHIIHHGQRYTFKDMGYSSAVVDVPVTRRGFPSAVVAHNFRTHMIDARSGGIADFDLAYATHVIDGRQLAYEEYMRSIALWLRDYLAKPNHPAQGYVISLSGGKDSAYGAVAVTTMIELDIRENGIAGFFDRFNQLSFREEVLRIEAKQGQAAAIAAIKKRMLTCVYLPTENSSTHTQNAARFLIKGGDLPDGTHVDGIGGKFYVAPVQAMLDEAVVAFTGLDLDKMVHENIKEILNGRILSLNKKDGHAVARAEVMRIIRDYINATPGHLPNLPPYITRNCVNPLPTWAHPTDDRILQNIQARIRLPIPWTIANQEGKIALVTSNESEAVHSYTTAGGDMHMGGANPIGGVPKHAITRSLDYLETHGLIGLKPLRSLTWVNHEKPSAELRKAVAGVAAQTDESDLGFTYEQSQFIEERLIVLRQTPLEVLPQMRSNAIFPRDLSALRDILISFTDRWESGQFKRIMGALAPHVGSNVDPHQAVRTTVLGDHFRTGCAYMTLEVLAELAGGPENFHTVFGLSVAQAKMTAGMNANFKTALIAWPLGKLQETANWQAFDATNRSILSFAGPAQTEFHPAARPTLAPAPLGG
jgi:NH3-dependent NAD+ synthetase/predicted amidohydrolase